jgi:hypothetical protein
MTTERAAATDTIAGDMLPGHLMRLVADELRARGFGVHLPAWEEERRMSVERWGGRCDLSVGGFGLVEWECIPWASNEADPMLVADIAAYLLTGKDEDYPCQGGGDNAHGMSFKGIAGNELRARGFDVGLEVYEDTDRFEVFAEIVVTNPVIHPNASVRISDDGGISWECDYPYEVAVIAGTQEYLDVLADPGGLADSIVSTIARAVWLSSGVPGGDADA